jgi:hypothetical protein
MNLSVALTTKHASEPAVQLEVWLDRHRQCRKREKVDRFSFDDHTLTVPAPAAWTPDTTHAILHALRRFLAPHDLSDAYGRVEVLTHRASRPAEACLTVRAFEIEAVAWVPPLRRIKDPESIDPSWWVNTPMLDFLRDTEALGSFPLTAVPTVPAIVTTRAPRVSSDGMAELKAAVARLLSVTLPSSQRARRIEMLQEVIDEFRDEEEDDL